MNTSAVQALVEAAVDTVPGLTFTPGVLTLAINVSELPAAYAVFDGYSMPQVSTNILDQTGRWRIPLLLNFDTATYATNMATLVPAICAAFKNGLTGCGLVTVEADSEPEFIAEAGPSLLVRKLIFVTVEYEEAR